MAASVEVQLGAVAAADAALRAALVGGSGADNAAALQAALDEQKRELTPHSQTQSARFRMTQTPFFPGRKGP